MSLQDDLNNLVEDPASVPLPVKIGATIALMILVLFLGYKFMIVDDIAELDAAKGKEPGLRADFEKKQKRASLLPVYKAQLEEMQRTFGSMVQQLPSQTEIPGLILDISETGLSNGLTIEVFEPKAEAMQEFYAEKPIKLKATGTYHELARFSSDIAALPRIVTLHDLELQPIDKKNGKDADQDDDTNKLQMQAVIKTYRYLEEDLDDDAS